MWRTITLALTLGLAACATVQGERLPVCDGKDRRPANPHGSVLLPTASPPAAPPSPVTPSSGACR